MDGPANRKVLDLLPKLVVVIDSRTGAGKRGPTPWKGARDAPTAGVGGAPATRGTRPPPLETSSVAVREIRFGRQQAEQGDLRDGIPFAIGYGRSPIHIFPADRRRGAVMSDWNFLAGVPLDERRA